MPGKGGDVSGKAISALASVAAAYLARKVIVFGWTKVTGRRPPDKAEDRDVAIGEAIAWAAIVGAGVGAARALATRLASSRRDAT